MIADTTALSLVVRHRPNAPLTPEEAAIREEVLRLAEARDLVLLGPVRLETLSGVRTEAAFEALRLALRAFADESLQLDDFELGARFANSLLNHGVQSTSVDMLIAAASARLDAPILTLDRDFPRYAQHLPIRLHSPP